ncbi:MAG: SDR family NAD(P)-dependent oxidoreductase, partial [Alphaproteobacteria bacterium]
MIRLDGKTAIVTGATRSIGEYIARGLHAAGAAVMVTGIDDAPGAAVAATLGGRAAYRHTDVESDEQIEACLADTKKHFGRLDILVNCACSYLDSGIATPRADWLVALNVNVVGPAIFTQKAVP